jgi:hypothetical protein
VVNEGERVGNRASCKLTGSSEVERYRSRSAERCARWEGGKIGERCADMTLSFTSVAWRADGHRSRRLNTQAEHRGMIESIVATCMKPGRPRTRPDDLKVW